MTAPRAARIRWRAQAARLVAEADPSARALLFDVGDIVEPIAHPDIDPLHSGAARYADAVVVSLAPFVLVSRTCDMVWRMRRPEHMRRIGADKEANRADEHLRHRCCIHAGVSATDVDPVRFDVALVRAHCMRILAEADRRAADREVFADWTRDRGMGPENRKHWPRGGWETCMACEGEGQRRPECSEPQCQDGVLVGDFLANLERGLAVRSVAVTTDAEGQVAVACPSCATKVRCGTCKGRGRVRKPAITPGFTAGPGLARTARRLLDTLDGRCPWAPDDAPEQSSSCPSCSPVGTVVAADGGVLRTSPGQVFGLISATGAMVVGRDPRLRVAIVGETVLMPCSDCRGTGHNIAGVLPLVCTRVRFSCP